VKAESAATPTADGEMKDAKAMYRHHHHRHHRHH
jgi:hypothetical protein